MVAEGLPLFGGAQIAVDTTLVSAVTEVPWVVPPFEMGLHWQLSDAARSAHTSN